MEILAVIVTVIFAIIHAKYDVSLIRDQIRINYPARVVVRLIVLGSIAFGVAYFQSLDWIAFTLLSCHLSAWFWCVFDFSLNKEWGKYEFYIGNTSFIDRQLRKIGVYYAMALKVAVLLATLFAYIIYYDKLFGS